MLDAHIDPLLAQKSHGTWAVLARGAEDLIPAPAAAAAVAAAAVAVAVVAAKGGS
jgi:hypothetical protein